MRKIAKHCFTCDQNVRKRLFDGYPLVGHFFAFHPVGLGLSLALAALMGLIFPAWVLGIHSFPSAPQRVNGDGGFFYSGWPLNFVIGLPVVFASLAWLSRTMVKSIDELTGGGGKVIGMQTGAAPFWQTFSEKLRTWRWRLLLIAFLLTVVCIGVDSYDLWRGYVTGSFGKDRLEAWDAAVYNGTIRWPGRRPSELGTLLFNIVSIIGFEGAAVFLGFFFTSFFLLFFFHFSKLLFSDGRYIFKPMWHDLDNRLGLHPLGPVFNLFMATTLLFQIGVFIKRIELIINNGNGPFSVWIFRVMESVHSGNTLFALFSSDSYQFNSLDHGAYIVLFSMIIPMVIVSYFPLSLYRNCIAKQRSQYAATQMRTFDGLVEAGRTKDAKQLKQMIYAARDATTWPNGTPAVMCFFAAMVVLLLVAWCPPIIAYAGVTGILVGIWTFFAKLFWPKERR